ncbi:single-stranded DNA-binding protein [Mesomycoplasma ovipneumoniae]|uniref:single-stranded DNA-binding protein n=1 Tax=Mesomycoplasma ovipneumoniae TaxID=29562 RepID=UPI0029647245|nr:single-stranded DNA-binding protein [Mesomycoplasma ovipneumoniae]MDW2910181.1 single-stranded DNA-binding protein [Mesomycoplasma ovipneumoniae]MDW2910400.1 single-stranded DNA-binding protein [Mesomycoplasma ovipneumoniae]MDW2917477.1 single-stranded DNA-binding protein [Mesomycoplasma ovipneumoniae]
MLNKMFVIGEVVSTVTTGQTAASNLTFARFKIEVKNKNNQKPTNFYVIGFGSKTKIAHEITIGDLVFIQGQIGLSSFQNEKQERIYYQEIKIEDYQIISKTPAKIEHPSQLKAHIEIDKQQQNKIFHEIFPEFE